MSELHPENLAEDIESGAYFTAARQWYFELFHTPIAERSYYIVIILLSIINMYFAVISFMGVFPLKVQAPFIIYSDDVMEDIPRIGRISTAGLPNNNYAVMNYLIASYVENRESYDLSKFELRYRSVWSQSTPEVATEYKNQIDPANSYSFYQQYTNRFKRVVSVRAINAESGPNGLLAHVVFDASVISLADGQEASHSSWRADLTYQYTNFFVDQSLDTDNPLARFFGLTGSTVKASGEKRQVVPMTFTVSDYKVKELLE